MACYVLSFVVRSCDSDLDSALCAHRVDVNMTTDKESGVDRTLLAYVHALRFRRDAHMLVGNNVCNV